MGNIYPDNLEAMRNSIDPEIPRHLLPKSGLRPLFGT